MSVAFAPQQSGSDTRVRTRVNANSSSPLQLFDPPPAAPSQRSLSDTTTLHLSERLGSPLQTQSDRPRSCSADATHSASTHGQGQEVRATPVAGRVRSDSQRAGSPRQDRVGATALERRTARTADLIAGDMLARVFGWYYLRIARPGDGPKSLFMKRWLFGLGLVNSVLGSLIVAANWDLVEEGRIWLLWASVSIALWGMGIHAYTHFTTAVDHGSVVSFSMTFIAIMTVIPLEMHAIYSVTVRHWSWFIVLLDGCLVFQTDKRVPSALATFIVVWLVLSSVDSGLSNHMRWEPFYNGTDFIPDICACEHPPCASDMSDALLRCCSQLLVFLIDFNITRGFSRAVSSEEAKMVAAISTAEDIATCLSAFDLDSADRLLGDDSKALPEKLHAAFSSVLKNLRNYKPYLPSSCLPVGAEDDGCGSFDDDSSDSEAQSCDSHRSFRRDPGTPVPHTPMPLTATASGTVVVGQAPQLGPRSSLSSTECSSRPSTLSGIHSPSFGPPDSGSLARHPIARHKSLAPPPRFRLQQLRASLVECNMHSTLTWYATSDASSLSEMFDKTVGAAAMCFGARGRGIVDLFVGDRIFASFNTSRPCARHSTHAVAAAKAYYRAVRGGTQHGVNVAVASGRVIGGDAGSADMRRYNVVGALPVVLGALERAGRAMDVGIVCNTACYNDTWHDAEIRRLPQNVVVEKREVRRGAEDEGSEARSETRSAGVFPGGWPEGIYSVLVDKEEKAAGAGAAQEWMYALESGANAAWTPYNAAVEAFLRGEPVGQVVADMEGKPMADLLERTLTPITEMIFHVYV